MSWNEPKTSSRRKIAALMSISAGCVLAAVLVASHAIHIQRSTAPSRTTHVSTSHQRTASSGALGVDALVTTLAQIDAFTQELHSEAVSGFVVEADRQYQEFLADFQRAYEAERLAAVRQVIPTRGSSGGTGGACGGATNGADAFINRESKGNPTIYNTQGSGAWGCYQIMPGTWASSCSDLGQHGSASASVQAACASRLPLSAWASSGPT